MSPDENKAIFLRFLAELRKGNLGIIDEVCSPKFTFYSPTYPDWPRGLDGARQLIRYGRSVFTEAQTTVEDIFADRDRVVVRWATRGTYRGEARPGFPNPGQHFAMGAISIYRFVDGKIEDDWGAEAFSMNGEPWGMSGGDGDPTS
jgi:ketosteroid isomerase-like protein